MGITLMTLAFYLTLESPDILRAELTEQKMSMLYLKSQVNPHFLYNTLDAIRIQAQLNGDKKVADLLMRLVDFFRLSVKVDRQMVALDDELELLEAYMELMCCRYPELRCEYDIDPDLGGAQVPNFILQPIVENSLLHGLKNKGYRGEVRISAEKTAEEVSLSVLAEQFHLNPQYISQLFKNEIGVGFLAYLTNIRMEKAKKLLLSTPLSVAEVAERSGYGDYRVFSKVFKKSEGVTPAQYRRDFLDSAESRDRR